MKFVNKNSFSLDDHTISADECLQKRKSTRPPIILDLRSPEEYEKEHLIGAHCLPADHIKDNLAQLPPFAEFILYGDEDDEKTGESVKMLNENGFNDLKFVSGGLAEITKTLRSSSEEVFLADLPKEEWPAKIETVLNEKVRPALASDGGGLTVIKIDEDRVYINYEGACRGCASSSTGTLRFIQSTLSIALNKEIEVISA